MFLDERSEVKITILSFAIGQLFTTFHHLDKVAEKEEEYFYIKCKFDAGIGNLILFFGQDYFNLYGNILKCYCLFPRIILVYMVFWRELWLVLGKSQKDLR